MQRRFLVPLLGVGVLLAGCGSTVNLSGAVTAAGDGLGVTTQAASTVAGGSSTPGLHGTGVVAGSRSGAVTTNPTVGAGSMPSGAGGIAAAGGSTSATIARPITVGFLSTAVGNAGSAGLNAGQSFSDVDLFNAAVAAMNRRGGLAGRKIIPIFSKTDTATTNWATDYQAACAKFTQDNHVSAVLGYSFVLMEGFETCLAKAGVLHLNGGFNLGDNESSRQFPSMFGTTNPSADLRYLVQIEGGVTTGTLTPKNKIGAINDSCPYDLRAWQRSALPYIRQANLNVVATQTLNCPQGAQDAAGTVAQAQNAVLKFRSAGVDRVLIEGVPLIFFMNQAEAQGYHPIYVITTGGAALEANNMPKTQLANIKGHGWFPASDVNRANQPALSSQQKLCLTMLKEGGITPTQYNDFLEAYTTCDALFLYDKVLRATGGQTALSLEKAAMEGLGSSFSGSSTLSGRTTFSATRHNAPAMWRAWNYQTACSCFRYTGPEYPTPTG